ncbi:MAG: DNA-binding protein WhiA [Clostridia bacterium]|nr:DNA-binding protein WhiA [Clostridia bacterium]
MNFTSDLKKELITKSFSHIVGERERTAATKAALSAFVRTSGEVGFTDGIPTFFIVSESEKIAEFFTALFYEAFGIELSVAHAAKDRLSGRDKLLLHCPVSEGARVLKELGFLRKKADGFKSWIEHSLVEDESARIAFIKGAFLGGGSCSVPREGASTGYHLEFAFSEEGIADDFCALLGDFELLAKTAQRKERFVVYIKSKEAISDFLSVVSAENALRKFTAFLEKRDESNRSNRAANCYAGNMDKTVQAAVKQVMAIERMKKLGALNELSEELKEIADLRVKNPSMSLKELAQRLKISKSCLNHRMRKLMSYAEKFTKEEE